MKVHIKAYATLARQVYKSGQTTGSTVTLELQDGGSVSDLLDVLHLPRHEAKIVFVNGHSQDFDYKLSEGDYVGIFPPLGGG